MYPVPLEYLYVALADMRREIEEDRTARRIAAAVSDESRPRRSRFWPNSVGSGGTARPATR